MGASLGPCSVDSVPAACGPEPENSEAQAEIRKEIAYAGIPREVSQKPDVHRDCGRLEQRRPGQHASVGVNDAANPRISRPYEIPALFNGPHPCLLKMLIWAPDRPYQASLVMVVSNSLPCRTNARLKAG